ncbi:MAG: hypothetical protein Q4E94_00235 [Clostridia bacterium]|nr:hypothetical protein [Clostridia bacterium]
MSELTNRASYLTGLAEGLKLDTEKPEGKVIDEMLKLISEMAEALEAIDDEQAFVADKLDEMEEVIDIIGENVFGDDEDDDVYTLVCDKCGAEIDFTEDDLDELACGEFVCPECGAEIELNFDECDCGCDCDCDCD